MAAAIPVSVVRPKTTAQMIIDLMVLVFNETKKRLDYLSMGDSG